MVKSLIYVTCVKCEPPIKQAMINQDVNTADEWLANHEHRTLSDTGRYVRPGYRG